MKTKKAVIRKSIFISAVFLLILFLSFTYYKISKLSVQGWSEKVSPIKDYKKDDYNIKKSFSQTKKNTTNFDRYQNLYYYFSKGYLNYASNSHALVYYPGEISSRGRRVNAIESFARYFPLFASWVYANNSSEIEFNDETVDLIPIFKNAILSGTDPNHIDYWGEIKDKDQRIVEAADIALALWISKAHIWTTYNQQEKTQIISWLEQATYRKIVDNNWNLFPITIVKSLEALGHHNQKDISYVAQLYNSYKKKHYIGNGWFDDPPKGVDYYNAWSIHYSLFWLDQMDPSFDPEFIRKSHTDFLKFYKYFFSSEGFPIMGRSTCYRMAAPAPIISGALIAKDQISPGFAFRTLDLTWRHFIENNALEYGKVSQGYYESNLSVLDSYSGAGSCLWSLRSLIIAFYVSNSIPFWNNEDVKLPIEVSDFSITNSDIGWTIVGKKSINQLNLKIDKNKSNSYQNIIKYNSINAIKEVIIKKPLRPKNSTALYNNPIYSNDGSLFK